MCSSNSSSGSSEYAFPLGEENTAGEEEQPVVNVADHGQHCNPFENSDVNSGEEYPYETFSGFIAYETEDVHTWVECPLTEMGFFNR